MADVTAFTASAGAFFAWWRDELVALLPPRLRRRLIGSPPAVLRPGDVPPAAQPLSKAHRKAIFRLPSDAVIVRETVLPLAAAGTLRETLRYEADRLTPFGGDELRLDARVVGRDRHAGTLRAEAIFVPRAVIDPAIAEAEAAGWQVTRVEVDDPGLRFAKLGAGSAASSRRRPVLVIALLVLFVCLVGYAARRASVDAGQAARLDAEVTRLRHALDAAGDGTEADLGRDLLAARAAKPMAAETLDALSRLLLDEAHLTRLRLDEERLTVAGEATNASALLSVLEESDAFSDVAFDKPLVIGAAGAPDRFSITMRLSVSP